MNYFKYLWLNKIWGLLIFFLIVASFVYYGRGEGAKWVAIFCGVITLVFLVGNFIAWRKVK
jgi:hypothetical protein